jgi:hypothetical protein
MGVLLFGLFLVLLGAAIELSMGSVRHWTDWSWPRRERPIGGTWVKVICGRVGTVVGVVAIIIGAVSIGTR